MHTIHSYSREFNTSYLRKTSSIHYSVLIRYTIKFPMCAHAFDYVFALVYHTILLLERVKKIQLYLVTLCAIASLSDYEYVSKLCHAIYNSDKLDKRKENYDAMGGGLI